MSELTRRSFLKFIALAPAAAALPSFAQAKLVEATSVIPQGWESSGMVREIIAYELTRDAYIARYDVMSADGDLHLHVDARLPRLRRKEIEEVRGVALRALSDELRHRNISWADLKPVPIPLGYTPPRISDG